jgi:ABC-2 type transport system ATP-binding protein
VSELAPVPGADEATVLTELVGAGVPVYGFTTARTSLEEIFIRVYGADSIEAATQPETVGVGA